MKAHINVGLTLDSVKEELYGEIRVEVNKEVQIKAIHWPSEELQKGALVHLENEIGKLLEKYGDEFGA